MATELLKAELTLVNDAGDSNWSATNSQQMKTKLGFSCCLSYWWWLKRWLRRRLTKDSLITKNGCVLFPELLSQLSYIKWVTRRSTTSYSYFSPARTWTAGWPVADTA